MSTLSSTTLGEETAVGEQLALFDVGMNLTEIRSEGEKLLHH
jgi:hypothetical protein